MSDMPTKSEVRPVVMSAASIIVPILVALLGVASMWGSFSEKIERIRADQIRDEISWSDLTKSVIDLRLTAATLSTQVGTLTMQVTALTQALYGRDTPRLGK